MVSEKIIAVFLIFAIILSALSIILTATLSIKTPVTVMGESKTEDTSGAKVKLFIAPPPTPAG